MPTPRDFVKHDLTQCRHGQLARQCLLCEQAAEIEQTWAALEGVTLHRNAPLKAEPVCQCKAEIEWLRTETKALREVIISAAHTLEQARIWDGMKWHWNINANACKRAWKILDAALAAKGE